jgi:hypothetical protein
MVLEANFFNLISMVGVMPSANIERTHEQNQKP